jgi:hypothetical protein
MIPPIVLSLSFHSSLGKQSPYIIIFVNSSAAVWLEELTAPRNKTKRVFTLLRQCQMPHVTDMKIVKVLKEGKIIGRWNAAFCPIFCPQR